MLAVAEAARNVACAGGTPIGATNCLNFGNPERPEIMWQLVEAIEGIAEACRALDVPITGGNVSLYNETDGEAIYPTPIIGVVGLIDDASRVVARAVPAAGDDVVLLGEDLGELGGSEYLKTVHGLVPATPRRSILHARSALQRLVVDGERRAGLLRSAHDCSDGGLAVTLAECCFDARRDRREPAVDWLLVADPTIGDVFGESASRVIVSAATERRSGLLARAAAAGRAGAPAIGTTGGDRVRISVAGCRVDRHPRRRRRANLVDVDRQH